jgi:hypothetical protein
MNLKTSIVVAVAIVAGLGAAFYVFGVLGGDHRTPVGQPALVSINAGNFSELKDSFNSTRGSVRIVALLSPT